MTQFPLKFLIGGYLLMSVVMLLIVAVGWQRGEPVLWRREPFSFMWNRTQFRDSMEVLYAVSAALIIWGGVANLPSSSAIVWGIGVIFGWWVRIFPAVVLGLLQRWGGKKPQILNLQSGVSQPSPPNGSPPPGGGGANPGSPYDPYGEL